MVKNRSVPTVVSSDSTLIVGVHFRNQKSLMSLEDSLKELTLLAETAGLNVVGVVTQQLIGPNPKTLVGKGKVDEIIALADELDAEIILFDDELSPRHQRELEILFGDNRRVLDRTALILDIFAKHARSHEGSLQVELAQYQYLLPRLTRAWTHLARQAGGGGGRAGSVGGVGLRGPGEKQLEVDRRLVNRRISYLKEELEKVRAHRGRHRARRKRARIPVVAIVGYTNAGKSTLLNSLAESDVYVADQLFATLDPTTRRIRLPGGQEALVTDTVGFIQKLPTTLVAAFQATLEEITEAELLLHVLDVSHPNVRSHAKAVEETLSEIGADHIPMVTVLNKVDLLRNPVTAKKALDSFPSAVAISAINKQGFDELLTAVNLRLFESYSTITVNLPYKEGALIALFHDQGKVDRIKNNRLGVVIEGRIPGRLIARYSRFETKVAGDSLVTQG